MMTTQHLLHSQSCDDYNHAAEWCCCGAPLKLRHLCNYGPVYLRVRELTGWDAETITEWIGSGWTPDLLVFLYAD